MELINYAFCKISFLLQKGVRKSCCTFFFTKYLLIANFRFLCKAQMCRCSVHVTYLVIGTRLRMLEMMKPASAWSRATRRTSSRQQLPLMTTSHEQQLSQSKSSAGPYWVSQQSLLSFLYFPRIYCDLLVMVQHVFWWCSV